MMTRKILFTLVFLTACSGGGDGESNSTDTTAAGTYTGKVQAQLSNCPFHTADELKIYDRVSLNGSTATVTIADGTQYTTTVDAAGFQYHFDRSTNLGGYGACDIVNTLTYSSIQARQADVVLDTDYICETLSCRATWFGTITKY